jgi:predicted phosphoribosyltransferase
MSIYKDRQEAGEKLAEELAKDSVITKAAKAGELVVFGLAKGGVIVAAAVAQKFGVPLDVLIVQKIGYPGNPEYAIGAVAEDGHPVWSAVADHYGIPNDYKEKQVEKAIEEIKRREKEYRQGKPLAKVKNKVVVLVDDGIATGFTMRAAISEVKNGGAKEIIVATPVIDPETAKDFKKIVRLIALEKPENFASIGQYYINFLQVTDEEVKEALKTK